MERMEGKARHGTLYSITRYQFGVSIFKGSDWIGRTYGRHFTAVLDTTWIGRIKVLCLSSDQTGSLCTSQSQELDGR